MVKYNKDYDDNLINKKLLKDWTGIHFDTWKKITGCFDQDYPLCLTNHVKVTGKYPRYTLKASNRNVEFNIFINIKSGIVFFELFKLKVQNAGQGLKAIREVVASATELCFDRIECLASCKRNSEDPHVGYVVLAKYGFTMQEKDHDNFLIDMKVAGRNEENLQRLISSEDGEQFWINNGDSWNAIFSLEQSPKSKNRIYLEEYLSKKSERSRN